MEEASMMGIKVLINNSGSRGLAELVYARSVFFFDDEPYLAVACYRVPDSTDAVLIAEGVEVRAEPFGFKCECDEEMAHTFLTATAIQLVGLMIHLRDAEMRRVIASRVRVEVSSNSREIVEEVKRLLRNGFPDGVSMDGLMSAF